MSQNMAMDVSMHFSPVMVNVFMHQVGLQQQVFIHENFIRFSVGDQAVTLIEHNDASGNLIDHT